MFAQEIPRDLGEKKRSMKEEKEEEEVGEERKELNTSSSRALSRGSILSFITSVSSSRSSIM